MVRGMALPLGVQVRKFQPEMVAIRDASKIPELKEALKGLPGRMPDILAGDEGAVEVARHSSAEVCACVRVQGGAQRRGEGRGERLRGGLRGASAQSAQAGRHVFAVAAMLA